MYVSIIKYYFYIKIHLHLVYKADYKVANELTICHYNYNKVSMIEI